MSETLLADARIGLGLGTEGLQLVVEPGTAPVDLNPWLLDACAATVREIGHHDVAPRPFDWENLLPLLRPGEELLWIVDYRRSDARGRDRVALTLALRFTGGQVRAPRELDDRRTRFSAILGHFRRQAFPESEVEPLGPQAVWDLFDARTGPSPATFCVVGMPSPKDLRDDDAHATREQDGAVYQSLNDVVESCLHLDRFRITFVVGRVSEATVDATLAAVTETHDRVRPFVEYQRNKTQTDAKSWLEQTSTGTSDSLGRPEMDPLYHRIGRGIVQFFGGARAGRGQGYRWESAPGTVTSGTTTSSSTSTGGQSTESDGGTYTMIASALQLADQSLDRYAQALYRARATGGYLGTVLVEADERDARLVADAVRGVLSGSRSKDRPLTVSPVRGDPRQLLLSTRPVFQALGEAPPILTDEQAGQLLLLPEAELPGFRLHQSVFLGRNASPGDGTGHRVRLGRFAFSSADGRGADVEVDADDLFRHTLVCGTTGSGKTRRVLKILNDLGALQDTRILVFETAKRTYRAELHRGGHPVPRIYTVGNSAASPLRINPFFFEPGTSLKRHVSVLADALSELMPTEALIGPKMREAVERAYLDCGWDIESAAFHGDGPPRWPTAIEFVATLREVARELKYGAEVNANYLGALEGRARVFLDATFQDIFSHAGNRPLDELFDRDTIIELEGLPSSEIDIPAFLLSILLERLRSHQARRPGVRWLVVVEEAHNVLPRTGEARKGSQESQGAHTLLKNVVRLLQEGRELGLGLVIVDQAPTMLARAVLKNTNTKIVLRLEDGEEMAEMGQALGLAEDVWPDLGVLRQGEAVIKASYMSQPVKSSRYPESELVPTVARPAEEARGTPDYRALEALWTRVLDGDVADEAWTAGLERASCGDGELARYGLGRALLRDGVGLEAATWIRKIGQLPCDLEALRVAADEVSAVAAGRRLRGSLGQLARWLLAAQLDLPLPSPRPDVAVVRSAAELLASGDTKPASAWEQALGRLCLLGPGQTVPPGAPIRGLLAERPPFEPVVRIQAVCARGDAAVRDVLGRRTLDPLALLGAVQVTLDPLMDGVPDPDGAPRHRLSAAVARILVRTARPSDAAELERWL